MGYINHKPQYVARWIKICYQDGSRFYITAFQMSQKEVLELRQTAEADRNVKTEIIFSVPPLGEVIVQEKIAHILF